MLVNRDILAIIAAQLAPRQIFNLLVTCKAFYKLINDNCFWNLVVVQRYGPSKATTRQDYVRSYFIEIRCLRTAVKCNDIDRVRQILIKSIDLDLCYGEDNDTVLHRLAKNYYNGLANDILQLILREGANPNIVDCYGWLPLHYYLYNRCTITIIELLIAAGTNLKCSPSVLAVAIKTWYHQDDVIRLLLENGADSNCRIDGDSLLTFAVLRYLENDHEILFRIIVALLEYGAQVNVMIGQVTLLEKVILDWVNRYDLVHTLITLGRADVNYSMSTYQTPLYYAVIRGYYNIVELLLQYGANRNIHDCNMKNLVGIAKAAGTYFKLEPLLLRGY